MAKKTKKKAKAKKTVKKAAKRAPATKKASVKKGTTKIAGLCESFSVKISKAADTKLRALAQKAQLPKSVQLRRTIDKALGVK